MSGSSARMSGDDVEPAEAFVNAPAAGPRPPGHKIVLAVVIALGVLILVGLGALVVGVALKMRGGDHRTAASAAGAAALVLPAGARIEAMQLSGERLVLRVKTDAGEEIDIVDTADGHVVSRIETAPPDIPH